MPIYDYRCNGCGKRASLLFRSFSAVDNAVCPKCGSTDLKRLVSAPNVLRGDYKTGRVDKLLNVDQEEFTNKNKILRWAHRMAEEMNGDAGKFLMERVEQMEEGHFAPAPAGGGGFVDDDDEPTNEAPAQAVDLASSGSSDEVSSSPVPPDSNT